MLHQKMAVGENKQACVCLCLLVMVLTIKGTEVNITMLRNYKAGSHRPQWKHF